MLKTGTAGSVFGDKVAKAKEKMEIADFISSLMDLQIAVEKADDAGIPFKSIKVKDVYAAYAAPGMQNLTIKAFLEKLDSGLPANGRGAQ